MTDCSCNNFPSWLGNVTFGANVGIGTTNPQAKLVVGDTTANVYQIAIPGGRLVGHWRGIAFTDATGGTTYGAIRFFNDAASDSSMRFLTWDGTTGGSEKMVIKGQGGNVGIGTPNPSKRLDVAGDAKLSGTLYVSSTPVANSSGCLYV